MCTGFASTWEIEVRLQIRRRVDQQLSRSRRAGLYASVTPGELSRQRKRPAPSLTQAQPHRASDNASRHVRSRLIEAKSSRSSACKFMRVLNCLRGDGAGVNRFPLCIVALPLRTKINEIGLVLFVNKFIAQSTCALEAYAKVCGRERECVMPE